MNLNFFKSQAEKDIVHRYRALFTTDLGKKVLEHMMAMNYVASDTRNPRDSCCDAAVKEGRRQAVLDIVKTMNQGIKYGHLGVVKEALIERNMDYED